MNKIKLMPDYECYPLWHADGQEFGDIDPNTLPISNDLIEDIIRWSDDYDNTLNRDDPIASGFLSDDEERMFIERGRRIADRLRQELNWKIEVEYFYDKV